MELLGMYPTWYVPWIGSAWVMGIIGVIHVVASHTSVGAAFLFALLETKAYKENKPEIMDFIRRFGVFLLVFSYIIGSITGPGIWYAITVASPRGVSALIHNFVWVWAAEWVFFLVEVIGVYALIYTIGKIDRKTHLKLTWSFALASWGTMVLIVGILSFMMWPGNEAWYETGSTSDAFFNLNFFAHLGIRTGSMIVMAAVVGLIVASRMKDMELKKTVTRMMAQLGIAGGFFGVMMFLWYLQTLPDNAKIMLDAHLLPRYRDAMIGIFLATVLYLAWAAWKPKYLNAPIAIVMLMLIGTFGVWPEERMRESMRKPFVAGQYVYSNQVIARDVPGKNILGETEAIGQQGLLKLHPWIPDDLRTITPENQKEVGKLLARITCSNCHSLEPGAPLRSLPDLLNTPDADMVAAFINGAIGKGAVPYMPHMPLPQAEVDAIAVYLASLHAPQSDATPPLASAQ